MNDQLHILLVDDNPEDRALFIRELRRDFPNLQINQITDAKHFARALESDKGDLVITDYQLRWSDGLAVLRSIKARWPECPVIMFTGTGSEEVAVEAMKAGLDDYVLKGANQYARLPGAVQRAVERKKHLRAAQSGGAITAFAENGIHRPARGRPGPCLQQCAHHDQRPR